jgi:hypothetical protein
VQSLEAVESADISVRDWRVQDMRPSSSRESNILIRRAGLRIEEPDESFAVGATATDDTEEIGCVDYIVFAVKLWDAEAAAAAISGASASVTHTSAQTSTMLASTTLR